MNRKNGNNSSIGTASHTEKHFPVAQNTTSTRRSRNKCQQYEKETKMCRSLRITCVGPSNELCKDYTEHKKKATKQSVIASGAIVNDPRHGVGMIMREFGTGFYEVRFHRDDTIKKYNREEVKKILLKQTKSK